MDGTDQRDMNMLMEKEDRSRVDRNEHSLHGCGVLLCACSHVQVALNATSTSNLAMRMMADALAVSAQEETDELLNILKEVCHTAFAGTCQDPLQLQAHCKRCSLSRSQAARRACDQLRKCKDMKQLGVTMICCMSYNLLHVC